MIIKLKLLPMKLLLLLLMMMLKPIKAAVVQNADKSLVVVVASL
jgi:hypothetical protein